MLALDVYENVLKGRRRSQAVAGGGLPFELSNSEVQQERQQYQSERQGHLMQRVLVDCVSMQWQLLSLTLRGFPRRPSRGSQWLHSCTVLS